MKKNAARHELESITRPRRNLPVVRRSENNAVTQFIGLNAPGEGETIFIYERILVPAAPKRAEFSRFWSSVGACSFRISSVALYAVTDVVEAPVPLLTVLFTVTFFLEPNVVLS
jgi:hypothetical protein